MGSSRTTQNQTQTRDPYAAATPGLQQAGTQISSYLSNPNTNQAYSGPRVAQMNDTTNQGLTNLAATNGANTSANYLTNTLNGDYLNAGNPYQAQLDNSIKASLMPNLNAQFSAAGMSGSTLHQGVLENALTNGLAQSHYQNYQNERANQQTAAGLLPQVEHNAAMDQVTAGQQREGYNQANITAGQQQFYDNQNAPMNGVRNAMPYLQQLAGAGGTSNTSGTSTSSPSLGQQLIGGAMMGTQAASAISGLPGMNGMFGARPPISGSNNGMFGARPPISGSNGLRW